MANTANQYFKQACETLMRGLLSTGTHCGDHFEIKLFHSMQYVSHIRNFLGRLINTLTLAINGEPLLPRAIVVVLDDDLINTINIDSFGMSLACGKILHYLFSEFHKIISARKDMLHLKAKRPHYPEVIWINPPFHSGFGNNAQRNKFTKAFDTTAAIYNDTWSLKLKRIWDPQSSDLFLKEANRFTAKGLMTYWMAVDRTMKFWDTALSPAHKVVSTHQDVENTGRPMNKKKNRHFNKFHWQKRREY